MVVSYYRIKNRSSRHISETILCDHHHVKWFTDHVQSQQQSAGRFLGHHPPDRQSGRCSARAPPRAQGSRRRPNAHGGCRAPAHRTALSLSSMLSCGSSLSAKLNRVFFFFFFNQNNATLLHYCPSAEHKDMGDFSVFLLQDLETKHPRVTSKICCQDTILASTLSLFKVDL